MIFNNLNYKTGCIKRNGNFNIKSIKFTILENSYHSSRLEIQMMLCANYYKKLYFRQLVSKNDLYIFKKKLSKRGAIKFIQNYFPKFEPSFVNYGYLPEDDHYYITLNSQEIVYD